MCAVVGRRPWRLLCFSYILAPPLGLLLGLLALVIPDHRVYVDEAALLAGFALPRSTTAAFTTSKIRDCSDGSTPQTAAAVLARRLTQHGMRAHAFDTRAAHNGTCVCTAILGRIDAPFGVSAGTLLVAVEVGEAADLSDADSHRATRIALRLADTLAAAPWLAKDVHLLLHSRCACACAVEAMTACPHGPVRHALDAHHRLGSGHPGGGIEAGARWGGPIRQVLTFALGGSARGGKRREGSASGGGGGVSEAAPSAVAIELAGVSGRLPNLDLYSTVWKVAAQRAINIPLVLPATGHLHQTATACNRHHASPSAGALHRLRNAARVDYAISAWRFALVLAWGAPRGEHASALSMGIDAISMSTLSARDGALQCPTRTPHAPTPLRDEQLVALLEGTIRSLSNLDESLHHSHYIYLLADSHSLLPFGHIGPLLHLPPLASLLLRAAAHTSARSAHAPSAAAAGMAVGLVYLACASLLLLPHFSPYVHSPLSPPPPPPPPSILLIVVHVVWASLAIGVAAIAYYLPRRLHPDALCAACCIGSACAVVASSCASLPLGLVGSLVLAAVVALGMPPPASTLPPPLSASVPRCLAHAAKELACLSLLSPWGLLVTVALATSETATTAVGADEAVSASWQLASTFGTLPFAFAVAAVTPVCAVAASIRLQRLAATWRQAERRNDAPQRSSSRTSSTFKKRRAD